MPTVREAISDLRTNFLNDPAGRRFGDDYMLVFLRDALNTLYYENPIAFNGKWTEADLLAFHNMAPAAALDTPLENILAASYFTILKNRVWTKASASTQRGQAQGNALSRDEEVADHGRTPRQR